MNLLAKITAALSLLSGGAIFGFFYAWVCSTMWGLDAADPRTAISAMQAMNASVRNAVFAPAFFGTPVIMGLAALFAALTGARAAALAFAAAALTYLGGGMILTMTVNVPMNEALAATPIPDAIEEAQRVWQAYSQPWQMWNVTRTVFSGIALMLTGLGIWLLARASGSASA